MTDICSFQPAQIVMYTTLSCSDCHRVKAFLEAHQVQFMQVGLEENEAATEFVMRVNKGQRSVPTIIFPDGTVLVEPTWEELRQKIQRA